MSIAAEALLAICGLERKKPIGASEGERAEKLPDRWRRKARSVLKGESTEFKAPAPVDVEKLWEKLNDPPAETELAVLLQEMTGPDLPTDYLAVLSNAYEFLRGVWPVSVVEGTFGPKILPPSSMEGWQAAALWQVANDPETVLDRMLDRSLTSDDLLTLKGIYPELHKMLVQIFSEEATDLVAARPSYEPARDVDLVLRAFFELPPDAPISAVSREAPKIAGKGLGAAIEFKELETKAQRLGSK